MVQVRIVALVLPAQLVTGSAWQSKLADNWQVNGTKQHYAAVRMLTDKWCS